MRLQYTLPRMTRVFLVEIRTLEHPAQAADKVRRALCKVYGVDNVLVGHRPDLGDDEHQPVDDDY